MRSLSASAQAQYLATVEARTGVVISLIAEVSQSYFNLRELDLELEISRNTLLIRQNTVVLFQNRVKGGVASGLEVAQAEGDVAVAAAAIPDLQRQIAQLENQINFLLGRGPGSIPRGTLLSNEYIPPQVPSGLPSTLLERRPDVLEAEDQLISANADIGVAKADYFPRVSLTGLLALRARASGISDRPTRSLRRRAAVCCSRSSPAAALTRRTKRRWRGATRRSPRT